MNFRLGEFLAAIAASLLGAAVLWTVNDYKRIAGNNNHQQNHSISVDDYVKSKPALMEKLQCVLMDRATRWTRTIHSQAIPLVAETDPDVAGVQRTRAAKPNETSTVVRKQKNKLPPLVIGTIRMGFGHYRISYAVASFASHHSHKKSSQQKKMDNDSDERDIYFHDIAAIGNDESSLIDDAEEVYSYASRTLTELPNKLERVIAKSTSNGGPNALRLQVQAARLMTALMDDLDKDCPIIATHPLVGAIAIQAGFKTVINLVVDNHPQWFVVVPGAINLVQGPRLYRELMKMGVPEEELELVGHWNPKNIVDTIPEATERRIGRVQNHSPLRLLIPVGGAGAQKSFLLELVKECAPLVKEGKLQLFLNAGDHDHMKIGFEEQLKECDLDYEIVTSVDGRDAFVNDLKDGKEPTKPLTVFAYDDIYPAVSTTDELVPYSDVLVCKPSEMAFYAVPKLMIRRVGDHEAKSANRAAEVGEGTLEAGTVPEAMAEIKQFYSKPNDLIAMNKMIQKNNDIGMYDGAKIAVERALEKSVAIASS